LDELFEASAAYRSSENFLQLMEFIRMFLSQTPFNSFLIFALVQNRVSSLRDWLLPMLMNGQVTVGDAEEMVEGELGMVAEREREKYGEK
jgi:hypothetical protein